MKKEKETSPPGEDSRKPSDKLEDLPVFTRAYDLAGWLLDRTQKFPKSSRFTFGQRIDNLALDIVEAVVTARYSRRRRVIITEANLKLTRLRVLLRLATGRRYLSRRRYFHVIEKIDEIGRMLGRWGKKGGQ